MRIDPDRPDRASMTVDSPPSIDPDGDRPSFVNVPAQAEEARWSRAMGWRQRGGRIARLSTSTGDRVVRELIEQELVTGIAGGSYADSEQPLPFAVIENFERRLDPGQLLADAYRGTAAGGLLVLTTTLPNKQELTALLFKEGFEKVAVRRAGRQHVVTARRSDLPPPYLRRQRLTVIMPVYNERKTFATALQMLLDKTIPGIDIEVILVESGSTDGTAEDVLLYGDHPRVRVILQEAPRGKGNAVRAGLAEATGDFVLIQDADLEYNMDDYEALLEPLSRFETGFVLGARHSPHGSWGMRQFGERNILSRFMNVGHVLFLSLFNAVYGQRLRDPFTMYKVFRRDCLHGLTLECDRFDFDWELTAKLIRAGYHPLELPVSYHSRSFEEGKKVSMIADPLTWIVACFKYRFARLYR